MNANSSPPTAVALLFCFAVIALGTLFPMLLYGCGIIRP